MSKTFEPRLFSSILSFNTKFLSHSLAYIGAAGFEDRATTVLDNLIRDGFKIESAIAITYEPYDSRNRVKEFREKLEKVSTSTSWIVYNRHDPQNFQNQIPALLRVIKSSSIIVDISAMSKLLIMILLQSLRRMHNELIIAYAEAEVYHPTRKEFEEAKKRIAGTPDFLTSDVYRILHVTSLSSSSMQGHPVLLITYPTFNHIEMVALHNELYPQRMTLIEGKPHEKHNEWRLEAIREINRKVMDDPDYRSESKILSTFDYIPNIESLEEIYREYKYTHKILLSPTGSKFQTVADFMFKQLHPDVQIVYPVTKSFIGEYSEGCKALWCISIKNFRDFISQLDRYRMDS